ncbi:hypothetical protein QTJ16_004836 [Diplocarpon rosae]|uniref:DUF7918 domain-containing protein n=1 Tax=Diplocarpon rosae TaxID=946125 RepID=A0AAD9SYZ0_9HELO|nr:hypothetical protein QTJ16_004836 [Diplocarpon rosae]PBP22477.1 hypothetical protein BUE80_DR006713 [Diplocarpon rosae]
MAILNAVPGLQVTIQSSNEDLQEYEDDGEWSQRRFAHISEGRRSQKFVESKADAEFRIRLTLKHPFKMDSQSLAFKVSVDGHGIAQATCTDSWFTRSSGYYMELITAKLDRISPTQLSSRALKFSSIKKGKWNLNMLMTTGSLALVDDPDSTRVKRDVKALAEIGQIVVSVFRAEHRDVYLPPLVNYSSAHHRPPAEVAEKALKGQAISHGVAYGEQQIVTRASKETYDLDGPNNPIGVFVFKYRSREDLQSELIIPRSLSPETAPAPALRARTSTGDSAEKRRLERMAVLKRELAELEGTALIKDEGQDVKPNRKRPSSGAGSSGRPFKSSRGASGSVFIDLTDD